MGGHLATDHFTCYNASFELEAKVLYDEKWQMDKELMI